jgi:serine/threonine protein kinase
VNTERIVGGRYQILRPLGQGGFGETCLVKDLHLPDEPKCVLKRLHPSSNNPQIWEIAQRLFYSESNILDKLSHHDRIPRLYARFEENSEFYLVQEWIEGQTIAEELNLTPLKYAGNESEVIHLLYDILEVLYFVHENKVIHRDIKPENLIRRQSDEKIVLIDFGSVKQINTQIQNLPGQLIKTIPIGTDGYMPVEQIQGQPGLYSDVYAVGMVGLQALIGIPPHGLAQDATTLEVVWKNRVSVSGELASVLEKMVQYHPQKRYPSAKEALAALQPLYSKYVASTLVVSPQGNIPTTEISILPIKEKPKVSLLLLSSLSLAIAVISLALVLQSYLQIDIIFPKHNSHPSNTSEGKGRF